MLKCNECSEIFEEQDEDICPRCGSDNLTEDIYAKDIDDCDKCPLKGFDCSTKVKSNGCGQCIENPCTSWNEDDLIFQGMYDRSDWD